MVTPLSQHVYVHGFLVSIFTHKFCNSLQYSSNVWLLCTYLLIFVSEVVDLKWIGPHAEGSDETLPHSLCRLMLGELHHQSLLHILNKPGEDCKISGLPFLEFQIIFLWGFLFAFEVVEFISAAYIDKHEP